MIVKIGLGTSLFDLCLPWPRATLALDACAIASASEHGGEKEDY